MTLICGRLFGFNSPLVFWGGVAVVVGGASAAYANVLVKARSIQLAPDHARGVVVDFDQIYIALIKPAIEQRRLEALRGDEEL